MLATLANARPLAGGQSLMPMMNMRLVEVDHLVDLGPCAELAGIEVADGRVSIGAMTRQCDLLRSSALREACPVLGCALSFVGHVQTRNRGTIGGSLGHLDPAAELPGICALHDAEITLSASRGARKLAMAELPAGFMTPAIDEDEIISRIEFACWPDPHGWDFREHAQRHGDFAVVGVGSLVSVHDGGIARAAIVLIGIAEGPVRLTEVEALLAGEQPSEALLREAGARARTLPMLSDHLVSEGYRQHLADVLVRRSLASSIARAREAVDA